MQQRGNQFHLHALAEGKLTNTDVELVADVEHFTHFGDGALETVGGNAVDFCVQFERFTRGQIPPKLVFLAEHERELAAVAVGAFPRNVTEHTGRAAGGIKQTGEHLERGGFARAVGAEKTDKLARFNLEADIIDGDELLVLAVKQPFDCAAKPRLLFVGAKGLGETADFNDGHGEMEYWSTGVLRCWKMVWSRFIAPLLHHSITPTAHRMSCFSK